MNWKQTTIAPDQTHHIDKDTRKEIYPYRFSSVMAFHHPGLAPVQNGNEAYHIRMDGKPQYTNRFIETFGFYDSLASVRTHKGWVHIHPNGDFAYEHVYRWTGNFQEKCCAVRTLDDVMLHIDQAGMPVYDQRWRYTGDFRYGIAVAQDETGFSRHIHRDGTFVHKNKYLDLDVFHKGYARAKDEQGWTHIDFRGQAIYKHRFSMVEPFYNNVARVEKQDGSLWLINTHGELLSCLRER